MVVTGFFAQWYNCHTLSETRDIECSRVQHRTRTRDIFTLCCMFNCRVDYCGHNVLAIIS